MPLQRSSEPPITKAGTRVRDLLIEAAGREFADKGLHGATSRRICLDAGVNLAAVNYHFGGFDALYVATLMEAHRRVMDAGLLDPDELAGLESAEKVKAVLRKMLSRLTLPISGSWEMRLVSLEMAAPTFANEDFIARSIEPQRRLLKSIIGEFLNKPPEDALVGRCLLTRDRALHHVVGRQSPRNRSFPAGHFRNRCWCGAPGRSYRAFRHGGTR